MNHLGKFITLEGVDGAGKTSHIEFIKEYLTNLKLDFIMTREPGGTELGEKLREILGYFHIWYIVDLNSQILHFLSAFRNIFNRVCDVCHMCDI